MLTDFYTRPADSFAHWAGERRDGSSARKKRAIRINAQRVIASGKVE
jgi:hypothetical protein